MTVAYLSPYVLSLVVGAVVTAVLCRYVWERRDDPGGGALATLLALVAASSALYAVALVTHDEPIRVFLERWLFCFNAVLPVVWLTFALEYTGHGYLLTRRRLALLLVPVAVLVPALWLAPGSDLVISAFPYRDVDGLAIVDQRLGEAFWLLLGYEYLLVVAGAGALVRFALTAPHLYRDQVLSLVVAAAVPLVVSVLSVTEHTPIRGLNVGAYAFVVSGLAFGNAVLRGDVFDRVPAARRLGRRAVTEHMEEGILLLDPQDTVVDANPVATRALAGDGTLVGRDVGDLLPALSDDERSDSTTVRSADGRRLYEVGRSTVTDQHDRPVARVLTLHDVTDRRRREHRLELLARVLRHDVRNDMTVVAGHAADLAAELDGERARRARTIREVASDLAQTADDARDLEGLLNRRDRDAPADAVDLVANAVATVERRYPEVAFEVDLGGPARVEEGALPRTVVENLVENAAEHNDADEPWVGITVERQGAVLGDRDAVVVEVADNGPGIRADDRQVLLDGAETPLTHGSGLGLWVVHWGVETLGGHVDYAEREGRGSVVTVRLPAVEERSALPGADG